MSRGKNSVIFIFFTVVLDAIGAGLLIPVFPDVIRRFSSDPSVVSEYYGYFMGVYSLMQFVASPVLGALSDRFGRKSILLISLFGASVDYVFMAFAPSLSLLFLGRVISGLTGANVTVTSSYMADVSTDANRSANFGLIGAGWGFGFIIGPLLGGLLGGLGATAPFIAAAMLNFLNFIYGVFVLPESLAKENRRNVQLANLNPMTSLIKILKPSPFLILVWLYFLIFLAGQVHPVNWTLYTQTKFGWTAWEVGMSLSLVGVMVAIAQGLLTRVIIPKIGEVHSLSLGLLVYVVTFALFAIANQGWMMYAILIPFALSGLSLPSLQAILAKYVPANEQGEVQGSLVSISAVSCVLAPTIYTFLFVKFTDKTTSYYFPGAAYAAASMICVGAIILWIRHTQSSSSKL